MQKKSSHTLHLLYTVYWYLTFMYKNSSGYFPENVLFCRTQGEFENVERVEKFELSKEEYQQRADTVAAYLKYASYPFPVVQFCGFRALFRLCLSMAQW